MSSRLRLLLTILILLAGCIPTKTLRTHVDPENSRGITQNRQTKYLKIHMKDGSLYVLDDWQTHDSLRILTGFGSHYNVNRALVSKLVKPEKGKPVFGEFEICFDDMAIIESNKLQGHGLNMATITIPGGIVALTALYCITNPKACFGSCPTFYTQQNGEWKMSAEGFSSSILPVFEERDIDKLHAAESACDTFNLLVTNEAMETHMIRHARLLAFPARENEQVFHTQEGEFFSCGNLQTPSACTVGNDDCLSLVNKIDKQEYFSLSDSGNLAKKEELILTFDSLDMQNPALVLGSRQSLMTTYLFYQTMAFSGSHYGAFAARVENGDKWMKSGFQRIQDKLGGIEVFVMNEKGRWDRVEELMENGPIATDFHLIKLPSPAKGKITVKLKMTQGLWRIDYAALTNRESRVEPIEISPESAWSEDLENEEALNLLNDPEQFLVTLPGDKYLLKYPLPSDGEYDFFLDTKGYYLEWMREEWMKEEDLNKIRLLFAFPGIYLRKMASAYKMAEPSMEEAFWNSRYEK